MSRTTLEGPLNDCVRHESAIKGLDNRMRDVEMKLAASGARVALIAAVAASVFSTILTVIASLAVFWATGKP